MLGFPEAEIADVAEDIRRRDDERLSEQVQGDAMSGSDRLLLQPRPEPLVGTLARESGNERVL
ncbi:hypothetical protein ACT9ST_24195 (plasmid) [Sphingobium limneticum]